MEVLIIGITAESLAFDLGYCSRQRFHSDHATCGKWDAHHTRRYRACSYPFCALTASPVPRIVVYEEMGGLYIKASSEQMLGFVLPSVLRNLYQGLANGGFGPVTGLRGIKGGYNGANHEGTIIDIYPTTANPDQLFDLAPNQQGWLVLPEGRWPREVWRRVARCPSISLCICSRSVDHAQDVSLFEINKKIHASAFKAEAPDP